MKDGKTIAIVPGSFDPITNGHLNIVKRAAQTYDVVYLAVMINSSKEYLLSITDRERLALIATKDIKNVSVISSEGMLWELAQALCADAIVKGYRNEEDYKYELSMAEFNYKHNPQAKTVLLQAEKELLSLSSTQVRNSLKNGISIDGLLPKDVEKELKNILQK